MNLLLCGLLAVPAAHAQDEVTLPVLANLPLVSGRCDDCFVAP